ncbi:MAG: radical SAM protein [Synergistaceae bacterium]|jgi:nitrogen fixation protein NifB|nr:radical SAM protein [Synergistaceae bacterium]
MRIAVATTDGMVISKHFGKTPEFCVIDIDDVSWTWEIVERRENSPACREGEHDAAAFERSIDVVADCETVFVSRIGPHAKIALERRGKQVLEVFGFIDETLEKYIAYLKKRRPKKKHRDVMTEHPCFSDGSHGRRGRLHLPVCRSCNIQCRFCVRAQNGTEQRPGVSRGILSADGAVSTVAKALSLCPEITVVGIAGPGDALASPEALDVFRLVHEKFPDLIKCLSTNGLALPGKASALRDVGVRSVTVTVNAVDPFIADEVVSHIVYDGEAIRGTEAGRLLIARQLSGIHEVSALGMVVKVNTVLIPTINDRHVGDIAKAVKEAGASMHNIIPLIPRHELSHIPAPSCAELGRARETAGIYLKQFRHCQHCRADACGIPGESDFSSQLYGSRSMETFSHG